MPKSKKNKQGKKPAASVEKETEVLKIKESKLPIRNFSFRSRSSKKKENESKLVDKEVIGSKITEQDVEEALKSDVENIGAVDEVAETSTPRVSVTFSSFDGDENSSSATLTSGSPPASRRTASESSSDRREDTPLDAPRRKPSFIQRKISELVYGPLRRSFSSAKDLDRPPLLTPTTKRRSWYNSLTSLKEDDARKDDAAVVAVVVDDVIRERACLERSQSLVVKSVVRSSFEGVPEEVLTQAARRRISCQNGLVQPSGRLATSLSTLEISSSQSGASSLPCHFNDEDYGTSTPRYRRNTAGEEVRRKFGGSSTRLQRHKAVRKDSKTPAGRSRSLTSIDALDPGMMVKGQPDMDSRSEPDTSDRLIVPPGGTVEVTSSYRRQKLARSQVSSSEYFSVSFEVGEDPGPDEFVPASKGVSLGEALGGLCARRGVDVTNVHVFLDVSKTPLPLGSTEASWMGGRHLRIKAKDDKGRGTLKTNQIPLRKTTGSYRGKGGRFFSSSTEDPGYAENIGQEGSFKGKSSKQRWSGLFGNNKDTKMESLVEQLNNYSKQGIPHALAHQDDCEEGLYNLEDDWGDIISGSTDMSEKMRQQQRAIWELVQTEVAYIRTLKVITNLFVACLSNLQAANILTEVDKARLFSNITEIYSANRRFWHQHILPMLAASRENKQSFDPRLMKEGFIKFDEIFDPYTKYCAEQSQCQQYCREKHQENELFTAYLVWCETQKDCNRLRLMDIVVKPMQRLTKYSLLLKAIHKNTESEEHRACLELMSKRVDEFVNSVNTTLRQRQDYERIRGIIARIESYDVVESKDDELEKLVRLHSDLDLTCPMPGCPATHRRHLVMESDLKMKDNTTSKMDVHCFLFTDMLLVCKVTTKKSSHEGRVKVIRQPYVVSRLVTQELPRDPPTLALAYLNEYGTASAAFTLSSSDAKLVKTWSEGIRKAQDLYASARVAVTAPVIPVSRQPSSSSCYYEDGEIDVDYDGDSHSCASLNMVGGLALSRSSRGSRMSSLAHSHSGSMEMNEASSMSSVSHSRGVSVENELRGSSLSSDEGNAILGPSDVHPKPSLPNPTSPAPPRRALLLKSPSPNTLSIQVPIFSSLGQSLPNLNIATTPHHPTPPTSLLLVPSTGKSAHHGLLSPGHRGVSYPPPSPPRGSLRRAIAIPQSRNPPLLKTRHVNSTTTSSLAVAAASSQKLHTTPVSSFDFDVPVIAGVSPPSEEGTTPEPLDGSARSPRHALMKRLARTDNRRYHTAGAIDDIKKQDSRDSSIHKRLSWNCGQQGASVPGPSPAISATSLARTRPAKRFVSTESVQSSSGVSSTESGQFGSLTSELDTPDIAEDVTSGRPTYEDAQSCCYDLPHLPHLPFPSPSTEAINMEMVKSCVSPVPENPDGLDNEDNLASGRDDLLRMKDLLLSDSSIEASNV